MFTKRKEFITLQSSMKIIHKCLTNQLCSCNFSSTYERERKREYKESDPLSKKKDLDENKQDKKKLKNS